MIANTVALESDDTVRSPGVRWVVTDEYGMLLEASPEAAEMLNLTTNGLRWRQLLAFFVVDGSIGARRFVPPRVDREGALRPRDKRPLRVRAEITQAHDWLISKGVLWIFTELEGDREGRSGTPHSAASHL